MAKLAKQLFFILIFISTLYGCRNEAYHQEISKFQFELNTEFANKEESPLLEEDRLKFHKLPFFTVQEKYKIEAKFRLTPNEAKFEMITTTERRPIYKKYGEATFELDNKELKLAIYQNQESSKNPVYVNMLFLPFADLTNGDLSYGGGRFIDLEIPKGDVIIIDFNKAYNPLCAYNHIYSCPVPPAENRMEVAIEAGVMAPPLHEDH